MRAQWTERFFATLEVALERWEEDFFRTLARYQKRATIVAFLAAAAGAVAGVIGFLTAVWIAWGR
jgi:hypothetical protein